MRISALEIINYRAARNVRLEGLSDAVVIAGPNGCGKSSIFDAIRLLKSIYGQYAPNEMQSWWGERQIDPTNIYQQSEKILYDNSIPLRITAHFLLSEVEKAYVKKNAIELFRSIRWSQLMRRRMEFGDTQAIDPSAKINDGEIVQKEAEQMAEAVLVRIDDECQEATVTMDPGTPPPNRRLTSATVGIFRVSARRPWYH